MSQDPDFITRDGCGALTDETALMASQHQSGKRRPAFLQDLLGHLVMAIQRRPAMAHHSDLNPPRTPPRRRISRHKPRPAAIAQDRPSYTHPSPATTSPRLLARRTGVVVEHLVPSAGLSHPLREHPLPLQTVPRIGLISHKPDTATRATVLSPPSAAFTCRDPESTPAAFHPTRPGACEASSATLVHLRSPEMGLPVHV